MDVANVINWKLVDETVKQFPLAQNIQIKKLQIRWAYNGSRQKLVSNLPNKCPWCEHEETTLHFL